MKQVYGADARTVGRADGWCLLARMLSEVFLDFGADAFGLEIVYRVIAPLPSSDRW